MSETFFILRLSHILSCTMLGEVRLKLRIFSQVWASQEARGKILLNLGKLQAFYLTLVGEKRQTSELILRMWTGIVLGVCVWPRKGWIPLGLGCGVVETIREVPAKEEWGKGVPISAHLSACREQSPVKPISGLELWGLSKVGELGLMINNGSKITAKLSTYMFTILESDEGTSFIWRQNKLAK